MIFKETHKDKTDREKGWNLTEEVLEADNFCMKNDVCLHRGCIDLDAIYMDLILYSSSMGANVEKSSVGLRIGKWSMAAE